MGTCVLLSGAPTALGQEYRGTEAQQQACMSDVFRLCSADIPNVSAIVACLRRERRQLSSGCRVVFGGRPTVSAGLRTRAHHAHRSERREVRYER
jgi:hypothetical protein